MLSALARVGLSESAECVLQSQRVLLQKATSSPNLESALKAATNVMPFVACAV
jgi:hypothetical protein